MQNIFHAVSGKNEIVPSVTGLLSDEDLYSQLAATRPIKLSWTHYSSILQESNKEARDWYEQEAAREMWGTRSLQRNVSTI